MTTGGEEPFIVVAHVVMSFVVRGQGGAHLADARGKAGTQSRFVVAGMIAASASAFTAANTGVENAYVGYDSATISGVTVTNVAYNVDSTDASKLSSIVFTETEDVSSG